MCIRAIGVIVAGLGVSVSTAFAQQTSEDGAARDWAVTVIDLAYADAAEVARVLSAVVPPGVTVVPYYQTNSLIISGERELLEALTGGGGSDASPEAEAEHEAADRGARVAVGELTARRSGRVHAGER